MGLVKQCITAMYKKNIQCLTKVYCFFFFVTVFLFYVYLFDDEYVVNIADDLSLDFLKWNEHRWSTSVNPF